MVLLYRHSVGAKGSGKGTLVFMQWQVTRNGLEYDLSLLNHGADDTGFDYWSSIPLKSIGYWYNHLFTVIISSELQVEWLDLTASEN